MVDTEHQERTLIDRLSGGVTTAGALLLDDKTHQSLTDDNDIG